MTDKREAPIAACERGPIMDHCGVLGIYTEKDLPLFKLGLEALRPLQTRGYDGAGFGAVTKNGTTFSHKDEGIIEDVFPKKIEQQYAHHSATTWVYQVRYGTSGNYSKENIQPLLINAKTPTFIAHNGQFSDGEDTPNVKHSDTVLFAKRLEKNPAPTWDEKITEELINTNGAWSLIIGTPDALFITRDKFGFRPLLYGVTKTKNTTVWVAASETTALEAIGIKEYNEVLPGSIIKIDQNGPLCIKKLLSQNKFAPCIFELIYIAEGRSKAHLPRRLPTEINKSPKTIEFRRACGQLLAQESPLTSKQVDMVIGIPGTGIPGGEAYAEELRLPYVQAITDRVPQSDQRTFMQANKEEILQKVLRHFNFNQEVLFEKRVVLVDDSIVRGNVTKGLVKLLKEHLGVKKVYIRSLSPQIDKGCHLGVNTKSTELISVRHKSDLEKMAKEIGADSLAFLSPKGLISAAGSDEFCTGCLLGSRPPLDHRGNMTDNGKEVTQEGIIMTLPKTVETIPLYLSH